MLWRFLIKGVCISFYREQSEVFEVFEQPIMILAEDRNINLVTVQVNWGEDSWVLDRQKGKSRVQGPYQEN